MKCGGEHHSGGKVDVYRQSHGYYGKCVKTTTLENGIVVWTRSSPVSLDPPDYRVGFPWTVTSLGQNSGTRQEMHQ
jgi:hypothetical protein